MLHIIRQYRILFMGLIANNFAEASNFKADQFNNLDENARNEYVKRNLSMIKNYVNGLDKVKDGVIVSNLYNKPVDDFSGANLTENLANEKAFKNILKSVGLDRYDIHEGVNLGEIMTKIDQFVSDKNQVITETINEKNTLQNDVNSTDNSQITGLNSINVVNNDVSNTENSSVLEKEEKQFLSNINNSNVQPLQGKLFGYATDGKFVLEIDDYVTIGSDPSYTFNHVPTTNEVEKVVTNFNKGINLSKWENLPSDMVDTRVDNTKVENAGAKLKDSKSQELISNNVSSFAGMEFIRTDSDSNEYLEDNQLKKLLQNDSKVLVQLLSEIQNALGTDGGYKFVDYKVLSNYSDMYPVLKKYGYEVPTLGLNDKKAINIYTTLVNYVKNQNEVAPKLPPEEKMKLLLDFDKDGSITTGMDKASIGEAQALYKILESPSSDGYEATIKNLGFSSSSELFAKMETNLFSTREAFQDALKSALKTGELSVLTRTDAPAKMGVELVKRNAEMQKTINNNVDLWFNTGHDVSKMQYIGNVKRETFIEQLKDLITPNSLGFGVLDDQKMKDLSVGGSLGYNMNIQKITHGLLDSFSLGFTDKGAGWAISKDLLSPFRNYMGGYKASLTAALANGMPMLSASAAVIDQANVQLKSLSQQEMDTKTTVSLGGSIGPGFVAGNINAVFRNEDTVIGMEEMTNSYQDRLFKNKASILKGATFETSGFKTNDSNDYDKQMYNLMVNMFKTETVKVPDSQKAEYLDKLFLPRFVQSYKDNLYKNKDGSFDISSVTAGTIILPGAIIPFIVAGGEYKYQNITETNRNTSIQEQVNYKEMDASTVGLTVDNLDGKKVFKIPTTFKTQDGNYGKIQLSSDLENQQAVVKNGYIYMGGGISANDITFLDHVSSKDVTRTIVIGKGVKETNKDSDNYGLYLPTKMSGFISTGVDVKEVKDVAEKLGTDEESFNEVQGVSNVLNTIISRDILSDKRTPGMTDLQRSIYNFRKTGSPSLDTCYSKYLVAISNDGFKKYVAKKTGLGDLADERVNYLINNSNKPGLSDSAKVFILQSMANHFMKSSKFNVLENGSMQLEKGNIKNYDKSRDKIFDKMMTNELGDSMASKVRQAKINWMSNYGKNTNFETVTTGQGTLGLTTNAYKKNVNGLLPLSGMFNVVGIGGKPAAEKIYGMTVADKIAVLDSVGSNILKSYASQLNAHGYNLDEKSVISFIANGGDQNAKVDMNTFFVKNGECLNDCVIVNLNLNIKGQQLPLTIGSTGTTSVGMVENKSLNIGGAYARTIDTEEKDVESSKEVQKEKAKEAQKEQAKERTKNPTPPETTPGHSEGKPPVQTETPPETNIGNGNGTETPIVTHEQDIPTTSSGGR